MTYLVLMSTQCQKKSAINGRGTIVKVQGTIVMVLGTVTTVPQNVPDCLYELSKLLSKKYQSLDKPNLCNRPLSRPKTPLESTALRRF